VLAYLEKMHQLLNNLAVAVAEKRSEVLIRDIRYGQSLRHDLMQICLATLGYTRVLFGYTRLHTVWLH
jgi:hypothetical protein